MNLKERDSSKKTFWLIVSQVQLDQKQNKKTKFIAQEGGGDTVRESSFSMQKGIFLWWH